MSEVDIYTCQRWIYILVRGVSMSEVDIVHLPEGRLTQKLTITPTLKHKIVFGKT